MTVHDNDELAGALGDPAGLREWPAPLGYRWTWKPDDGRLAGEWRPVTTPKRCRFTTGPGHRTCGAPAVAELQRGPARTSWWGYCGDHLYGRRLYDGVIYHVVTERVA